MMTNNINAKIIKRFQPSSDGHGFVAAAKPTLPRYRDYKWALLRVIGFKNEGQSALVRRLGDTTGGHYEMSSDCLTPIHELPISQMRRATCIGWPDRETGGMKALMRAIQRNKTSQA